VVWMVLVNTAKNYCLTSMDVSSVFVMVWERLRTLAFNTGD
jgi:hypothetical protein